jgi:hypothetical protein
MLAFAWLRKGSGGATQRAEWAKDIPLTTSEGGSVDELTSEKFLGAAELLRDGGKLVGLITLLSISNDFSYPGIKFQSTRLEFVGRKFFTTNRPPALAGSQGLMSKDQGSMIPITDKFYETSDPAFPKSWPGTMPIVVRDLTRPPPKWKLLATDEMVAAFWKIVDFTVRGIQHYKDRCSTEAQDSPNLKVLQDKLNLYITELAAARKLARNITTEVVFAPTDQEALDLSLSYRERLDDMAEFLGLTGWNRIVVIGGRRDALRAAGLPSSATDVAKALEKVSWASGKDVTRDTASKCLTIWDRLANLPDAIEVVMNAQAYYGRSSPYEDWTKLSVIISACRSNAELIWVMQTILAERVHGKRNDNYANAELQKKGSPLQVMMMRKKLVDGILATFFQTSIDSLGTLVSSRPELKPELEALKECRNTFGTVTLYYKQGRAHQPDQTVGSNAEAWLPKWVQVTARRVMRAAHEGRKDGVLLGLVVSPPKGGVSAVKYEDIMVVQDMADDIDEIRKTHAVWLAEREGRTVIGLVDGGPQGSANTDEKKNGDGRAEQPIDTDDVLNLRQELAAVAKETRCAHASLLVQPTSAAGCAAAIKATAAWKKSSAGGATQVATRVCFVYAVGMSWDPRRIEGTNPKKQRRTPVALWREDFTLFMDTMHQLVTAQSENYIAVYPGRAQRQGGGLAVEAGLFVENQLLEVVRSSGKAWRIKRAVIVYNATSVDCGRGVHGGLQDRGMQIQTITTTRIQQFLRLSAMLLLPSCSCRALAMRVQCSCNDVIAWLFLLLLLCSHPCSYQTGQELGNNMARAWQEHDDTSMPIIWQEHVKSIL